MSDKVDEKPEGSSPRTKSPAAPSEPKSTKSWSTKKRTSKETSKFQHEYIDAEEAEISDFQNFPSCDEEDLLRGVYELWDDSLKQKLRKLVPFLETECVSKTVVIFFNSLQGVCCFQEKTRDRLKEFFVTRNLSSFKESQTGIFLTRRLALPVLSAETEAFSKVDVLIHVSIPFTPTPETSLAFKQQKSAELVVDFESYNSRLKLVSKSVSTRVRNIHLIANAHDFGNLKRTLSAYEYCHVKEDRENLRNVAQFNQMFDVRSAELPRFELALIQAKPLATKKGLSLLDRLKALEVSHAKGETVVSETEKRKDSVKIVS